ncbi:hypothetical protein ACFQRL_07525 [Microbacterium fluvii]|uniref:Lipoprotein n=1 Tax=Microbacterium fluvii TaxID=415215 RepID=A0ABW2HFN6_9MICO|nr:hypothetical protein [Microbacterium fluvii]MCU4672436.1 hypothetical protein [Microbacterium fluvii]
MFSTARAAVPLLALTAVLLAGCSAASEATAAEVAEKCGGEDAGIVVSGDGIAYTQAQDTTGDAYTCLLDELLDDQADRDELLSAIETGASAPQTTSYGDLAIAWNNTDGTDMWIAFDPQ